MKGFNLLVLLAVVMLSAGFIYFARANTSQESETTPLTDQVDSTLNFDLMSYLDYSETNLADSQAKGETVLFFAATVWCQTCAELEEEIISRQEDIPEDITILKVDYDNNLEMNRKYGVTAQHTLVVLNQDGEEINRWVGGDLDYLLNQVERS